MFNAEKHYKDRHDVNSYKHPWANLERVTEHV